MTDQITDSYSFDGSCPEWCSHGGACAVEREAISRAEAYAESAWERQAEMGLDDELEREMAGRL